MLRTTLRVFAYSFAFAVTTGFVQPALAQSKSLADITGWINDKMRDQTQVVLHYRSSYQQEVTTQHGGSEFHTDTNEGDVTVRLESSSVDGCTLRFSYSESTFGVDKTVGFGDPYRVDHKRAFTLSVPLMQVLSVSPARMHITPYSVVEGYSCQNECLVQVLHFKTTDRAVTGTDDGSPVAWTQVDLPVFSADAAQRLQNAFSDAAQACGAAQPKPELY